MRAISDVPHSLNNSIISKRHLDEDDRREREREKRKRRKANQKSFSQKLREIIIS
jgi:hypothetical protein